MNHQIHPILSAVELGARKRRHDRIIGVMIVAAIFAVGLFIAIPLWFHWMEVVLKFWGFKKTAITWTVSPDGTDDNCDSASPKASIKHAITCMLPGDTLFIRSGRWNSGD